jgi:exodeoxyribonuclease V alpha subunit
MNPFQTYSEIWGKTGRTGAGIGPSGIGDRYAPQACVALLYAGMIAEYDLLVNRILYDKVYPSGDPGDQALQLFLMMMAASLNRGNVFLPGNETGMVAAWESMLLSCLPAGHYEPQNNDMAGLLKNIENRFGECARLSALFFSCLNKGAYQEIISANGAPKPICISGNPAKFYYNRYLEAEIALARFLKERFFVRPAIDEAAAWLLKKSMREIFIERPFCDGKGRPVAFDTVQKAAVALAAVNNTTIITGGPGTGKTTVVTQVLRARVNADPDIVPEEDILITAPTGRAAARLQESIAQAIGSLGSAGMSPRELSLRNLRGRTVHGVLDYDPTTGKFLRNAGSPVNARIVVVDEVSMLDIDIFRCLLDALPRDAALVLLGDRNQLPSVEAGAVLGDIALPFYKDFSGSVKDQPVPSLSSKMLAFLGDVLDTNLPEGLVLNQNNMLRDRFIVCVTNHRSTREISQIAFAINTPRSRENVADELFANRAAATDLLDINGRGPGVFFADAGAVSECEKRWYDAFFGKEHVLLVREACAHIERLACGKGIGGHTPERLRRSLNESDLSPGLFSCLDRAVILCIVRKGAAGSERANFVAAGANCLPPARVDENGLFSGCIAMVTRNSPQCGLYNGDRGILLRLLGRDWFALRKPCVKGDRPFMYELYGADEIPGLVPSFALTVHKSQGSEFANVMLVLTETDHVLLTREIVYTAITRAKERIVVCGAHKVFRTAIAREVARRSGLTERMQE